MRIITERLDGYISSIAEHKDVLTTSQLVTLKELLGNDENQEPILVEFEEFEPTELDSLYTLVKTLQRKVITNDSNLLANATTRDLSSLIGGITSLLRAFSAQQQKVDEAKEMGDLKQAVLEAIMPLPEDVRQRFFNSLDAQA